ncbi:hypothetical protein [Haloechinothrix salitolerans]|uniref:Glycosyl hydrolases family 18 n=1 Tax=Haloechinothrix salitolerans TaxID=926830 RepID=A0ABW2C1Q9_9PSEU
MSKHARRHVLTRTLLLVALALIAAVLRKPRWRRLLRDRLDDVQRPYPPRPPKGRTPARHRATEDRTIWREVTTSARRLRQAFHAVGATDARAAWRLAMPDGWRYIRWAGWRRPADPIPWRTSTPVGSLTGVIGVVLAVLLISSVVSQVGNAPPRTFLTTAKAFRDNHVDFTRHLLNTPAARDAPTSSPKRARSRSDTDRSKPKSTGSESRHAPTPLGKKAVPVNRDRGPVRVQPYLYLNSDHVPDVGAVMRRTGVTEFTLAFVLSDGGCRAVWDGSPRVGRDAGTVISAIRANGGDVVVSFGGWAGRKLGTHCRDAETLARAYQRMIDRYRLRAIDIDIEYREFENAKAQDRVLRALRIVAARNPALTTRHPGEGGQRAERAPALGACTVRRGRAPRVLVHGTWTGGMCSALMR